MLSFGSAAFREDGVLVGTYSQNLETLPGASPDPKTEQWWRGRPEAYAACRSGARPAEEVMPEYVRWVESLGELPVFVAYPAGYDFTFMYWYLVRFAGRSPFSHSALDIKTLAMSLLGGGYRDATKRNMPKRWFSKRPHTHVALDDALEQGELFCAMLRELRSR
jgi:DNA polymerase III alpha subunit (gram-positive type)